MYYNVLPLEVKEKLRREYRKRLITVSLFGAATVLVIGAVSLLPALITLAGKEQALVVREGALNKLKKAQSGDTTLKALSDTKEKIQALGEVDIRYKPSDLIRRVLEQKTSGISILNVLYGAQGDGHVLTVTGSASTRADLVSFREALQKTEPFQRVDVPIGELAKSTNISFTLTLGGDF